jgi:hypothetical protein
MRSLIALSPTQFYLGRKPLALHLIDENMASLGDHCPLTGVSQSKHGERCYLQVCLVDRTTVAVAWQIAAETIVPLNREAGEGVGFRAQLLLFLDDLLPSVFGKPLLSDQPDRSLIAWH